MKKPSILTHYNLLKYFSIFFLLISISFLNIGGCGNGTTTIGPEGGEIISSDENLRLTIPPGALTENTEITVSKLSPNEIPPELGNPNINIVYNLSPDGLQFLIPIKVELVSDKEPLQADNSIRSNVPILLYESNGEVSILTNPGFMIFREFNTTIVTGEISHFSNIALLDLEELIIELDIVPPDPLPEDDFMINLDLTPSAPGNININVVENGDDLNLNPFVFEEIFDNNVIELQITGSCPPEPAVGTSPNETGFTLDFNINIEDLFITGGFSPESTFIDGAIFGGSIDTRPLVPLLSDNESAGAICSLAEALIPPPTPVEPPPPLPPLPDPPLKIEGTYTGNDNCDIGSMNLSISGENIVIDQIGSSSNITFTPSQFDMDGIAIEFMSPNNLVLFGVPSHTCTLTCNDLDNVTISCTNTIGGTCDETLMLVQ